MDIKAISLKKYLKKSDSMYKNIIIASTRARQIIDERFQEFDDEEDIEDSDQLEALIDNVDHDLEKPITVALDEFMNEELSWKNDNEEESDEQRNS